MWILAKILVIVRQDKAQPETQASSFGDVAFQAMLAQDTAGALPLIRQPGSDGFSLSSSPLFQVRNFVHPHIRGEDGS